MKTLVVKVSGATGAFGNYKQSKIRIQNANGCTAGYFMVKASASINISTDDAVLKSGTTLTNAYNSSGYTSSITLTANQVKYIYIDKEFDIDIYFSDITKLEEIDASIANSIDGGTIPNTIPYRGFEMYSKDLMKLSMAKKLGLRYSIKDPENFNPESFMFFENLTCLFIGGVTETLLFDTIMLPNNVMSNLSIINWALKILPANFNCLVNCVSIYLLTNPSWANLHNATFSPSHHCTFFNNPNVSEEDANTVLNFKNNFFGENEGNWHCNV